MLSLGLTMGLTGKVRNSTPPFFSKATFNNALASGTTFSRNVTTYDETGTLSPVNTPRFTTKNKAFAGKPVFVDTGLNVGAGNTTIDATGVSHDNTTPIVVADDTANQQLKVYTGDPLTFVRNVSYASIESDLGAPANHEYRPNLVMIHSGLIIIGLERIVSTVVTGVTFAVSQDLLETINYVQARDTSGTQITASATVSIGDMPAIATSADGFLRRWSGGVFPVDGLNDRLGMWFTWADYQSKSGGPGGGQAGLFRATRSTPTGLWVVEDNREVFRYENALEGGFHTHAADICTAGMRIVWGDVGYRNRVSLHVFDKENYETASITSVEDWHGGYSFGTLVTRKSPQPTSPTPGPDNTVIWVGDEGYSNAYSLADTTSIDDKPAFTKIEDFTKYSLQGISYETAAPLHLRWCYGENHMWVLGGGDADLYMISNNGVDFAPLHIAEDIAGEINTDGKYLYALNDSGNILRAPIPPIRIVKPLIIEQGGTNEIGPEAWTALGGVGTKPASTTMREVQYTSGEYRFVDDNSLVDPQPVVPPRDPTKRMYFFEWTVDASDSGRWRFNSTSGVATFSGQYAFQYWAYSLSDMSGMAETYLRTLASSYTNPINGRLMDFEDDRDWNRFVEFCTIDAVNARPVFQIQSRANSTTQPQKLLVQPIGLTEGENYTYPIASLTTAETPDELFQQAITVTDQTWTVAMTFKWPFYAFANTAADQIATIYADANNHIGITHTKTDATTGQIELAITSGGSLADTLILNTQRIKRGDAVHLIVSSDGTDILASASSYSAYATDTGTAQLAALPVRVHNGNADQSAVAPLFFGAIGWADAAQTLAEQRTSIATLNYF